MKIRYKILMLMVLYVVGIATITTLALYSFNKTSQIQASINLGNQLQRESGEIKSLMKDIVFDLFVPEMYGQIRSLTYSPRSAVTVSQLQEAVATYQSTFSDFMNNSNFALSSDDLIREQYYTAMLMNDKAMDKLASMHESLLIVRDRYRSEDNIYNAMQKDEALVPFFTEFQETSYYFSNSFDSFMNYFIKSLREEGQRLEKAVFRMFIIISASFLLVSLGFTIYLARDVAGKLKRVEDTLRQVSYGNFSAKIDIQSKDEFGAFAKTFSNLIRVLKENVDNILNLTRDVSSFISEGSELSQLLDLVASSVLQDTSTDSVQIYRLKKNGDTELSINKGVEISDEETGNIRDFLFSRVIRPNTYLLQRDTADTTLSQNFNEVKSLLAIPLVVDTRVFGVLVSLRTESHFSDLGVTRLVTFAEYTSLLIDHFFKYNELLERREAQYQALHSQVQPHFLYNVLSSILGLNRKGDSEGIVKTIDALKGMMRYIQSQNKWTVLEDELEFINRYCQLQKIRFGERFNYTISSDDSVSHFRLPRLILQPLIENAVCHGIEPLENGGLLEVAITGVRRRGEMGVDILIKDNGVGFDTSNLKKKSNIGLMNVQQRLQISFPDAVFTISSKPGQGTKVDIQL